MYSKSVTAMCRSFRITFGQIPRTNAGNNNVNSKMNSRRDTSFNLGKYCEYAPNLIRLNKKIL